MIGTLTRLLVDCLPLLEADDAAIIVTSGDHPELMASHHTVWRSLLVAAGYASVRAVIGPLSLAPVRCGVEQLGEQGPFLPERRCSGRSQADPGPGPPVLEHLRSPLGGSKGGDGQDLFAEPVITERAEKYGRSPAQIVQLWDIDQGIAVIPRSTNPTRIAANFDVFDFTLTPEEVAGINSLESGVRRGPDPDSITVETLDITIEEA